MHLLPTMSQWAGCSLVAGIWQGLVLTVVVWLFLRLVPRTTAAVRFAIWTGVLLLTVLLPLLESLHPAGRAAVEGAAPLFHVEPRWSLGIGAVWLALSLVRAFDLGVHAVRLRRLRLRSVVVEEDEVQALVRSLSGRRRVQLCLSDEIDRPSVIGFFAPRILVPAWLYGQLSRDELRQVVLHEVEHLRRGDDWMNLLQKLSLVLFPLNPVLVWVERRLCLERELACDDGVLRRTGAPKAYATCLTTLAERGLDHRALSLALGAMARQSELGRRVHRILRKERSMTPMQSRVLTGGVAVALFVGAAGLAECPQLVSFAAIHPQETASAGLPDAVIPDPAVARQTERALAQPATFHVEQSGTFHGKHSAPKMTLLKAAASSVHRRPRALTAEAAVPVAVKAKISPKAHPPVVQTVARPQRGTAPNVIVMTSWTEYRTGAAQTVVTGSTILVPYAAVPTANGWLIFQL